MSVEALWLVRFIAPQRGTIGAGVVVLESGKIYGGDGQYFYLGTYQVSGTKFTANVNVHRHDPTGVSIFGPYDQFPIGMTGEIDSAGSMISAVGLNKTSGHQVHLALKKLTALP